MFVALALPPPKLVSQYNPLEKPFFMFFKYYWKYINKKGGVIHITKVSW